MARWARASLNSDGVASSPSSGGAAGVDRATDLGQQRRAVTRGCLRILSDECPGFRQPGGGLLQSAMGLAGQRGGQGRAWIRDR